MPGVAINDSGKYKVLKIYDPVYQKMFTSRDLPQSLSYFQDETRETGS